MKPSERVALFITVGIFGTIAVCVLSGYAYRIEFEYQDPGRGGRFYIDGTPYNDSTLQESK
ncbi:hypothetical protein [Limnoraphis robusta]|uniref:Uncharacterized protein n=1 Tax=Limnoraphis robusta CCNP1315 TaxID=3110306 RepID=A0ABU5TX34_9CYAN|nr:hypothetical protein [Limnoraphis robusta]MEA5519455.1 hypothetical protein [Limnoraphis robusta CCNP1315]MEA5547306.1 hypothetical protein [Limnoraphis robusta CCNP1324]